MNNKYQVYAGGIVGILLFTLALSALPESLNFFREEKSAMFAFTLTVIMIMLYEVRPVSYTHLTLPTSDLV